MKKVETNLAPKAIGLYSQGVVFDKGRYQLIPKLVRLRVMIFRSRQIR